MPTYLRLFFADRGEAVVQPFPWPELTPRTVVVRQDFSVVSAGTERANLLGMPNTSGAFPYFAGYSGAGTVLQCGAQVTTVQPGDRVVVTWGGHGSHAFVPEEKLIRIQDPAIDLLEAAFAHLTAFPLLALRKLQIELGESVMVAGLGLLGMLAVQLANLAGAIPILGADPDPARRQLASRLGATRIFDPTDPAFKDDVLAATEGNGVNAVVEVSGQARALQQALDYVAWEGRIALLGCTRISDVPIDFYQHVHRRGVTMIGAHTFTRPHQESRPGAWTTRDDCLTFLKFLAAGKIRVRELVSSVITPAEAPAAYARLAQEEHPPLGWVLNWQSPA